jgi:hypothetical protein
VDRGAGIVQPERGGGVDLADIWLRQATPDLLRIRQVASRLGLSCSLARRAALRVRDLSANRDPALKLAMFTAA